MLIVRFVPVDRKGRDAGKAAIKTAAELMRNRGFSFLVFPEGTRTRTGRMLDFRRGGFYLAIESGRRILPMTISGTFDLMPKGRFQIKKGRIKVAFHDPVSVEGFDEDNMPALMTKVRGVIEQGLNK